MRAGTAFVVIVLAVVAGVYVRCDRKGHRPHAQLLKNEFSYTIR